MATDWKDILGGLAVPSADDTSESSNLTAAREDNKPSRKSVTLFYERKGRAGKPVTILAEFTGTDDDGIETLASDLKRRLGTGGSVRGGEILIQGDRREEVKKLLKEFGLIK